MSLPEYSILILDDSLEDRELYSGYLKQDPLNIYNIFTTESLEEALSFLTENTPNLIIIDYLLPELDGFLAFLQQKILLCNGEISLILLTRYGEEISSVQAINNVVQEYIIKENLTCVQLLSYVHKLLNQINLNQQIKRQEQQQLLSSILLNIHKSIRLNDILQTAVQDIRELLQVDRVIIYQFDAEMNGEIVAESVLPQWTACLNIQIKNSCFQENYPLAYQEGKISAIADIYQAGLTASHIELLERFEVKANLVAPILINNNALKTQPLWGFLIIDQCSGTRQWGTNELNLIKQIPLQLSIAIQQAELYENLQNINASLGQKALSRTKKLKATQARFRAIFNQIFQFTGLLSKDGILLEVNQTALDFIGLNSEDIINRPFWEIYSWSISAKTQDELKEAIVRAGQGELIRYEVEVLGKDNQVMTIDFSLRPFTEKAGKVTMLIAEGRDITARKETEKVLQFQASVLNRIDNAVISTDLNGTIKTWNYAAERVYGYKAEEIIGKSVALLYFPEEIAQMESLVFEPLLRQGRHELELRNRTKSGQEIYIYLWLSVLRDGEGNIVSCLGCSTNITQLKQIQTKYRSLIEHIAGVVYTSPLTNTPQYAYISPQIQSLLGVSQEEWLAGFMNSWRDYVHPEDREWTMQKFQESISTGTPLNMEYRMVTRDGRIIWVKDSASLVLAEDNQTWIMQGVAIDITERKEWEVKMQQINLQLNQVNLELSRATRLKDEFLANISHELRTPLNAILGITEGLQEEVYGIINQKQRSVLRTIESSGQQLLQLINDILDMAKIEAGQLDLECSPTSIPQLCTASVTFIKQQAFQKNIQLEVKVPANLPLLLLDGRLMRQVLINLLNNAVKFTPVFGHITLEVTEVEHSTLGTALKMSVSNTGIGIALEDFDKLFRPFVQIDSALNRQYEGTGLGLALVKRIVEKHGGQVEVSSKVNVGSCFMVYLPYDKLLESSLVNKTSLTLDSPLNTTVRQKSPRILLAEDNDVNASTFISYLTAKGYFLIWSKNGQEAIDMAKNELPDLILMDIQMPKINGLEAIKQIRNEPQLVNIPIIALTALAMPGDQEKCLEAGANEYLTKPLKLRQLTTIMQKFLS